MVEIILRRIFLFLSTLRQMQILCPKMTFGNPWKAKQPLNLRVCCLETFQDLFLAHLEFKNGITKYAINCNFNLIWFFCLHFTEVWLSIITLTLAKTCKYKLFFFLFFKYEHNSVIIFSWRISSSMFKFISSGNSLDL